MNDETIYEENPVNENVASKEPKQNTENISKNNNGTPETIGTKKSNQKGMATAGIAGAAGIAGVALGVLTPLQVFPDAPEDGEVIDLDVENEDVNDAPSPTEHLVGHDMDVASSVDDSMSFNEAFAAARHEVGPGGMFVWHGNTYGTYYANEWNSMSPEEQDQYWADVHHTTSNLNDSIQETSQTDDWNVNSSETAQMDEDQQHVPNDDDDGNTDGSSSNTEPEPIDSNEPLTGVDPEPGSEPLDSNEPLTGVDPEPGSEPLDSNEPLAGVEPEPGSEPLDSNEPLAGVEPEPGPEPLDSNEPLAGVEPEPEPEPIDPNEPLAGVELDPEPEPIDPNEPLAEVEPDPLFLDEDSVLEVYDIDGDGAIDAALVDANGNDIADLVVDTTGDGNLDTLIIDPEVDDDGSLYASEVHDIDGVVVLDDGAMFDSGNEVLDPDPGLLDTGDLETMDDGIADINPDVDSFASMDLDPDVPIDNNLDMNDFV